MKTMRQGESADVWKKSWPAFLQTNDMFIIISESYHHLISIYHHLISMQHIFPFFSLRFEQNQGPSSTLEKPQLELECHIYNIAYPYLIFVIKHINTINIEISNIYIIYIYCFLTFFTFYRSHFGSSFSRTLRIARPPPLAKRPYTDPAHPLATLLLRPRFGQDW